MTKFTHSRKKSDSVAFAKFLYSASSAPVKRRIAKRRKLKEIERRIVRQKEQAGYHYINPRITRREAKRELETGEKFRPKTQQEYNAEIRESTPQP